MASLLTTGNKVGNFLIREQWRDRNYCRVDAAVTLSSLSQREVGTLVVQTGGAGAFAEFAAGTVIAADDVLGIIVDERINDPVFLATGEASATLQTGDDNASRILAVMVSGDAIVRLDGLYIKSAAKTSNGVGYDAADADVAAIVAQLKAQGITVQDSLKGMFSENRAFASL